jgi:hypothetical protein
MKLSAVVERIIALAVAMHNHREQELLRLYPQIHSSGFVLMKSKDLAKLTAAPERQQLRDLLRGLPFAQLVAVELLYLLGRGVLNAGDDLLDLYTQVSDRCDFGPSTLDYLTGKPLDRELPEAVQELADLGIALDDLLD